MYKYFFGILVDGIAKITKASSLCCFLFLWEWGSGMVDHSISAGQ